MTPRARILLACVLACVNVALWATRNLLRRVSTFDRRARAPRALVVLGSGGHTSEMFSLLARLGDDVCAERAYVVANTDAGSVRKAEVFERSRGRERARVHAIARAREVGQSWTSSAASAARALADAVGVVVRERPDVVICNGPGTCVPVVLVAMVMRAVGWERPTTVFVESACRARSLSLTGKIFYHARCVDAVFVMWERVAELYPRATFIGRAV